MFAKNFRLIYWGVIYLTKEILLGTYNVKFYFFFSEFFRKRDITIPCGHTVWQTQKEIFNFLTLNFTFLSLIVLASNCSILYSVFFFFFLQFLISPLLFVYYHNPTIYYTQQLASLSIFPHWLNTVPISNYNLIPSNSIVYSLFLSAQPVWYFGLFY